MPCAVVKDGLVVAVIMASPDDPLPPGADMLVACPSDGSVIPGWTWTAEGGFAPPPDPDEVVF